MNFGDTVTIPGCALKSRHLEASSGCAAVDSLLGGGVPNTSFVIYDETRSRTYADVLLRLFLAEGYYEGHDILYVSPPLDSTECLLDRLPARCEASPSNSGGVGGRVADGTSGADGDGMQIAWRYAPVRAINSSVAKTPTRYDLATTVPDDILSSSSSVVTRWPSFVDEPFSYTALLQKIREMLSREEYAKSKGPRPSGAAKPRLLRIVIRNLGSPLWEDDDKLPGFLARIPFLTRHAYSIVFASTDSTTTTPAVTRQLETTADAFLRLEAMDELERKIYDKAHGYLRLVRLPRLTSLAPPVPPAVDLTFELHRKSFDVKILHLPPALEEGDEEKKGRTGGGGSCGVAAQF